MDGNRLNEACRVAFSAMVHDLGKFAQRADIPCSKGQKDAHLQLYCRYHKEGQWFSHQHAAYTALAFNVIEQNAPDLIRGDMSPFASRSSDSWDITDSLVNAAAMHHNPQTFLQWVIATADRIASGFERETFEGYNDSEEHRNYLQSRELTLFEQISLKDRKQDTLAYCYPLKPLSAKNIFPVQKAKVEPTDDAKAKQEYRALWDAFCDGLKKIPASHRSSWQLWLDHFDTAWLTYTHAIPSATAFGVRPEVSLYDHSKTTAALAVALWRYHHTHQKEDAEAVKKLADRSDWNEAKFLLIQGDFFGIQDFIFAEGSETNRQAAKLLRGRSLHVSLLMETAAIKILEALDLPSTSQIINAAGKCLIVAENTEETIEKLKTVQAELNQWFIEHTYGIAGIGLAWQSACCNDFLEGEGNNSGFSVLMKKLFEQLETAKLQRFDLCHQVSPVIPMENFESPCAWHGHLPADNPDRKENEQPSSAISRDQILMGQQLVKSERILLLNDAAGISEGGNTVLCELPVFGYRIAFTQDEDITGRFAKLAQDGILRRCWDFSLPDSPDAVLWNGYARRNINGYVPTFKDDDLIQKEKYKDVEETAVIGQIKTFNHIACEDRQLTNDGKTKGLTALMTLKGDVDNLGRIFQQGLRRTTFAKMASMSRQMNAFFAVYLPALCQGRYPNTYTVFAGGDDFFLIGSWYSTQKLAKDLASAFKIYVANNPEIHFSVGMVMTKPGYPVYALAEAAEEALSAAKQIDGKNAVNLFSIPVQWTTWQQLDKAEETLEELKETYGLSSGYLYSLFSLIDMAERERTGNDIEASMWRSQLAYRTIRTLILKDRQAKQTAMIHVTGEIGEKGINAFRAAYRIPLSNYFYRQR